MEIKQFLLNLMVIRIEYNKLYKFVKEILSKSGLDKFSTNAVSKGLCEASLRGVDSHGIKLLPHYIESAIKGRKNPKPNFKFIKKFPSVYLLDADHAFGHAAGIKAINKSMQLTNKYGLSVIAVKNSSHPGAMAPIVLDAAKKGYIVLAFTHADALQLTYNGIRPFFGTNPICFAAPRKKEEPFCLDMSTSKFTWNKLMNYKNLKKKLPKNVAADKFGKITTDPFKAVSLLSIGDYKGFGLSAMVEIFCSIFTGMNYGRDIPSMYKHSIKKKRKLGQFYLTIRSDACVSKKNFLSRLKKMSVSVRKEPNKKKEKILLPNDKEIYCSILRKKIGIPIEQKLFKNLIKLSKKHKVKLI